MELSVTALIFSGRPNPAWTARDQDAAALTQALHAAAPAPHASALAPQGLGYRGLLIGEVQDSKGGWTVFARRIIRAGCVQVDPGRAIEHQALQTGRRVLDPALYKTLLDAMGRS